MGEFTPTIVGQPVEPAPVAVFGGVLSIKHLLPLYRPLLASGSDNSLSDAKRFFPIPRDSLGDPAEMYEQFEEQVLGVHEKLNERLVLIGHSMGGLAATMVGVEHPDKVAAVVCLAGAQEGVRHNTPSMWALKQWLRNPPESKHIDHDSDFMQEHRHKIATRWSPDVELHLISPTFDDMILAPQGLGLELPPGQAAKRYIVAPNWRRLHNLLGLLPNMPADVQVLESRLPTSHYSLQLSRAVIQHAQDVRRVSASGPLATVPEHPLLFDHQAPPRRVEWQLKASA